MVHSWNEECMHYRRLRLQTYQIDTILKRAINIEFTAITRILYIHAVVSFSNFKFISPVSPYI